MRRIFLLLMCVGAIHIFYEIQMVYAQETEEIVVEKVAPGTQETVSDNAKNPTTAPDTDGDAISKEEDKTELDAQSGREKLPILPDSSQVNEELSQPFSEDDRLILQDGLDSAMPEEGVAMDYFPQGDDGNTAKEENLPQLRLSLDFCNLSEKELKAGESAEFSASFINHSKNQDVYGLKITVQTGSAAVRPPGTAFYFEKVGPKEKIYIDGSMTVAKNAEDGLVPVLFVLEYEDKDGNVSERSEKIELLVRQPVKMELGQAKIPPVLYASDLVEIPVTVLNLSRTGVYNVRVHLEGMGLFPSEDIFIGNMEAGVRGEGTMDVYVGTKTMRTAGAEDSAEEAEKYGPVSGTITLEYEDAEGNTHTVTQEYQTKIKKAKILSLEVEEEEETNPWQNSVFAAILTGTSALILLLSAQIKRKNILLEEARKAGL